MSEKVEENLNAKKLILKPEEIEAESFRIISEELGDRVIEPSQEAVVKRVIHTTADFSYVESLYFSENACEKGISLLSSGATIVTDTTMALSGINKKKAKDLGCEVLCFITNSEVVEEAKQRGCTRAKVAVEKASRFSPVIYVVGNAPTALLTLDEMMKLGTAKPDFIVGVPVGFVNVVESKELIIASKVPCIVSRGRKGGSNVAAAIINALLYQI